MKTQHALAIVILLAVVSGCSDKGTQGPDIVAPEQIGNVSLSFSSAPAEITTIVARLTRPGHAPREVQLSISDSGQSASGSFYSVAIGMWRLRVEALDNTSTVRYAGEANVEVLPQQIAQVTLHLLPTSGGIDIIVTWGNGGGQSLIVNGSFELGPPVSTYLLLDPGSTAITGWTVTRGQIDYVAYWQHAHGSKSIDLNGTPGLGGIKQTVPTTPGATYRLRFFFSGNPEGPPLIKTLGVSAGGGSTQFTFNTSGRTIYNMGWQTMTWHFVANDSETDIEFYSLDPFVTNAGPAIDNVSLEQVN